MGLQGYNQKSAEEMDELVALDPGGQGTGFACVPLPSLLKARPRSVVVPG